MTTSSLGEIWQDGQPGPFSLLPVPVVKRVIVDSFAVVAHEGIAPILFTSLPMPKRRGADL